MDLEKRRSRRQTWQTVGLLLPAGIVVVIFLMIPLFIVFVYSFFERDAYGGVVPTFTLQNYQSLLQPIYLPIFLNSFQIAIYTTLVCLLVGYPVAYFIAFRAKRFAPILLLLIIIPFWTNFLARMSAWIALLNRNGLINSLLMKIHLIDEPLKLLNTYGAVLVGLLYAFLPSAVFPIYAALESIDRSLLEAAQDLGATPFRAFREVTFPLSLPGVVAATLFVFVPSIGVYVIPALLGGGKEIMIGNLIVMLYLEFRNIPFGSAVAIVLLVIVLLGLALYLRLLRSAEELRS